MSQTCKQEVSFQPRKSFSSSPLSEAAMVLTRGCRSSLFLTAFARRLPVCVHVMRTLPPVWRFPHLSVCVCAELEEEASRPEKDTKTLSSDLVEYVQHMIREHGANYKVSQPSRLPVLS